jgi:hypothetical protein
MCLSRWQPLISPRAAQADPAIIVTIDGVMQPIE